MFSIHFVFVFVIGHEFCFDLHTWVNKDASGILVKVKTKFNYMIAIDMILKA